VKRHKPVTKKLVRKYFGEDAKIRGFDGSYRVTTPTGGEVVTSSKGMRLITGGDDTYRAMILLIGECWGKGTAGPGSREFMLGAMAHGEACGVPIRPNFKSRGAVFARWFVFIIILLIGFGIGGGQQDSSIPFATVVVAVLTVAAMARSAKREDQRKAEELGFHYPRIHGLSRAASREDAEQKGWL
jgi:hypothetical protein